MADLPNLPGLPATAPLTTLPPPGNDQQQAVGASSGLDLLASASATLSPSPLISVPAVPDATDPTTHSSSSGSSQHSSQADTTPTTTSNSTSHARAFEWFPIAEDKSQPSADELQSMDQPGITALNHDHWKAVTFTSLNDPEYVPVDETSHMWAVNGFNGTADAPNTSLVMHGTAFRLAGHNWRLKLYPKGNETGYISVYLECEDLQPNSSAHTFEDGGDATYSSEIMRPILPALATLGAPALTPFRRRRCISVQFSIIMYNPQVPTVHHHRVSTHMFSKEAPDAGFSRFGPASVRDLGRRQYGARAPLLQADSLTFCAYVRVLKNPTGLLFSDATVHQSGLSQYSRLGLQRFDNQDFLDIGTNLLVAVLALSFLPPVRKMLYAAGQQSSDQGDREQVPKPLLKSLQEFLEDIRDPHNTGEPVKCSVVEALGSHGISVYETQSHDALMMLEKLQTILDRELRDSENDSVKSLFMPHGFRCKLPQDKTTSVRAGLRLLMDSEHIFADSFPRVMLVELSRWAFSHHDREWKRNSKPITMNDPLRLTKDSSGTYRLYALILHRGKYRSDRFQALIRPDVKTWFRFDGNAPCGLDAIQVTSKEALEEGQKYAYLAIYVRDDVAKSDMIEDSKTFQGYPEATWQTLKVWDEHTNTAHRPSAGQSSDDEDVEMPDASVILDPSKGVTLDLAEDLPKTLEDHLGQEYHKGESNKHHWHGKGYHIYFNGDVYDGNFCEGKRHGTGFQTFQNGDTYRGEWVADKMHGEGVFTQAKTGNTYQGIFKDGQQDAPGTTTWRVPESRNRTCHVCWLQAQDAVFMDCGHVCACLDCARRIDTCPICRRPVVRAVKLHFS